MKRLHIIGGKNHGKTTLVVELVEELTRRGITVGTIKHTHHRHELDIPGKDSHRHRLAGAAAVGILSPSMIATFLPAVQNASEVDRYVMLAPMFVRCQLVLVEGDAQALAPKIEVWRSELGTLPLASHDRSVLAMVTDDPPPTAVKVISRSDVRGLAEWILNQFLGYPVA
jgi:molybdopterin-guanine dinucleotide biosynthesis adapter protein